MHLRPQIVCYELKGDLSPVVLKEILHDSFENFQITRICMENHASMTGWQKLIIIIIIKTHKVQLSMGHDQMRFTIS